MNSINHFEKILRCFPERIYKQIYGLDNQLRNNLEEIRVYRGKKIQLFSQGRRIELDDITDGSTINLILNNLMKFSYYAYEEDLAKGFITIDGGHRVGICGKTVIENGRVKIIRDISSLNIRYSKEIIGCSDAIKSLLTSSRNVNNILISSPPNCGKTTLLRDIARYLSQNCYKVGICDERSEIAGMFNGLSSYEFGPMTDVLDGCPKAEGMTMLVRSMSPNVIITDEVGRAEDIRAIEDCINSGVSIITSVHGDSMTELKNGVLKELISKGVFQYIIFLSNKPYTGTVKEVVYV